MERSIDHLAATHELAQERRKAGKPVWDRTIKIKDIIHEDQDNETNAHVVKVAHAIAARVKAGVPAGWLDIYSEDFDTELADDIFYGLESMSENDDEEGALVNEFNGLLNMLYDWADTKRVWLG